MLPGVVWARFDATYGKKNDPSQFEFVVRSILFGLTSYAVTYLIYQCFHWKFEMIDLSKAEKTSIISRDLVMQMLAAVVVGFILAVVWLYCVTYKLITRFLQLIRATKRYGDEDVWDYTLNSSDPEFLFAHIRDFENKVTYAGWIRVFSETEKLRELIMTNVDIYDFDGNLISSPPRLYISRKTDAIHIEFPMKPEDYNDGYRPLPPEQLKQPWLYE